VENDTAGFHQLWNRYAKDVQRFAYHLSGDAALAEDVVSETFLRAWTTRDRLRLSTVKSYLLAIARNLVFQQARGRRRQVALEVDVAAGQTVAASVENRQELERVKAAVAELPETERSALLMRAEGMPYEEIAAVLGIPSTTVRVKVHRARLRIAESKTRSVK
jgi:RNA polymerase sigma factor (sigma-70 family)